MFRFRQSGIKLINRRKSWKKRGGRKNWTRTKKNCTISEYKTDANQITLIQLFLQISVHW